MSTLYYIASDDTPKGPYTVDQLRQRSLTPDDMVWCNGMHDWTRAADVDELQQLFTAPAAPPAFNRQRFDQTYNGSAPSVTTAHNYEPTDKTCPPNYRWLAIIAFLGIIPCAIVAIIKSVMVSRLWEEGKHEASAKQSRSTLIWALAGIIIGIPANIFYFLYNEELMLKLIELLNP